MKKSVLKMVIWTMAFCTSPVSVMGQGASTIDVEEISTGKSGVMHEETFEHTTVTITLGKGNQVIGFYMIAADFEGNYPVLLHFVLVSSTDDKIFTSVPIKVPLSLMQKAMEERLPL